jgi:integrase
LFFFYSFLNIMLLEYRDFAQRYKGKSRNISNSYVQYYRSLVALIGVADLAVPPTSANKRKLIQWTKTLPRARTTKRAVLDVWEAAGGIHADYACAFNSEFDAFDVEEAYRVFVESRAIVKRSKGPRGVCAKKYLDPYTGVALSKSQLRLGFEALARLAGTVTLQRAQQFIETKGKLIGFRIMALELSGFGHMDELQRYVTHRQGELLGYKRIHAGLAGRYETPHYDALRTALGVPLERIHTLDVETIAERMKTIKPVSRGLCRACFQVVQHLLSKTNVAGLHTLADLLPYQFTLNTRADVFVKDPWRKCLLEHILKKHELRLNSSYADIRASKLRYNVARDLEFISDHAAGTFDAQIPRGADPLKWFLANCTFQMAYDVILSRGLNHVADNSRVKSEHAQHHAIKHVSRMIALLKRADICSNEIGHLTPSVFLGAIENQRIRHDGSRREYTAEEVDSMVAAAKGNPVYTVIMLILKEHALRAGAIQHLKYYDLFHPDNSPKRKVSVREKAGVLREIIPSERLLRELVSYAQHIADAYPHIDLQLFYVFNPNNPSRPLPHSTLSSKIKQLGVGVVDVVCHLHAFRHTIVGRLMDAGNSIETVAKWMGHQNVNTTMNSYWLRSAEQLSKSINNPMNGRYEDTSQDKITRALSIIHTYNETLAEHIRSQPESQELRRLYTAIMQKIPNLETQLRAIAGS